MDDPAAGAVGVVVRTGKAACDMQSLLATRHLSRQCGQPGVILIVGLPRDRSGPLAVQAKRGSTCQFKARMKTARTWRAVEIN